MNHYIEKESYYELHVTNNKDNDIVIIDKCDYEKCSKHTWYLKESSNNFYATSTINKKKVRLHRFILNVSDSKIIVDHFDRDTLNCRRDNLRIGNSSLNNRNKSFRKDNTSNRTGVCFDDRGISSRWKATFGNARVGNLRQKSFSVKKYGYNEAFELACKHRSQWEKEYNILSETIKNDE